jgi:Holliday junction resolvase
MFGNIKNNNLDIMTEQQIQTKIKKKLQERGWFVTKLIKTSTNGIPDILAIKYGKAMFIEVKKENGKLAPLQQMRLEELIQAGAIVKVWSDYEVDFITNKV